MVEDVSVTYSTKSIIAAVLKQSLACRQDFGPAVDFGLPESHEKEVAQMLFVS